MPEGFSFIAEPFSMVIRLIDVCDIRGNTSYRRGSVSLQKEQLGELILDSQEQLYRVAKTILRSDDDCADAIQNCIVKAFTKLHTLKSEKYAKSWLIRILINACYDLARENQKVIPLADVREMESTQDAVRTCGEYTELYEALMKLAETERLVVELYYLEGYRIREIADILEITENAVKKRLFRARENLKMQLKEA